MTIYPAILLVILAIAFFLMLPTQPYMSGLGWGYYPSVIMALIVFALGFAILRAPRGRLH